MNKSKYSAPEALRKLAEIIEATEEQVKESMRPHPCPIDWENLDLSPGEGEVDDFFPEPEMGHTRQAAVAYATLFSAINWFNDPPSVISEIDYYAERDFPGNPYAHILSYEQFALRKMEEGYVCPRQILFRLDRGAWVDDVVANMV